MKIMVFDVGNAACSIIASPNNYGMMVDCGCHSEKNNPVDILNDINVSNWLKIKPYSTQAGRVYKMALLHITHPDDDHIRNAKRIKEEYEPYLLLKRKYEEFPDGHLINQDYKNYIDIKYRGDNPETVEWGFNANKTFKIPMENLKSDETLNKKIRNNSSIIRYVEYSGVKVLFAGDLEKEGWRWLAENDQSFRDQLKNGLDILVAPHHGHKSGFPDSLFSITGDVKVVIHSKGSEANIEGTDVSSQYSNNSSGVIYKGLNDGGSYYGKVLTTRSNGHIYIDVAEKNFTVYTQKASSNHKKV